MANRPTRKKLLKFAGIFLGTLIVLLGAFHFWFLAHAKDILEDMVESQSKGRLKMKVKKFRFGYFSRRMELEKAVFYNTDTITGNTAYRFTVDKINLQAYALWPIVFKKEFLIDSLTLGNPDIVITRLRQPDKADSKIRKDFSIPEEMGKVYHSIQDALQVLKVKRFEIENAKLTLINRLQPQEQPIVISNLFFHLDNLQIDTTQLKGNEKFLFGENLVLRTRDQDILFPDGRHRLSFERFRINMRKKLVEFDGCTIAATKVDSSDASFKVHFDALMLTNIDFDTLYRSEVIKADSVYCENPRFTLDVSLDKGKDRKKAQPKLEDIIQQLTGNLQLGFVIVNNGSFDINTVRNGKPSSFTSEKNNFEIQGFTVDRSSPHPIEVKSFAMAIRNYENFLRDSSVSVQFDSILFNNNRIRLSNFRIHELSDGKIGNRFSMPQFELRGLAWDEFVFNRRLKAQGATLYEPFIDFTASKVRKARRPVFETLAGIGKMVELDELNIIDGQIDLVLKNGSQLHMENATLDINSRELFNANTFPQIGRSVHTIEFTHGWLKTRRFNAELENAKYLQDSSSFYAGKITVANTSNTLHATAKGVYLPRFTFDDSSGRLNIHGISWSQAALKFDIPQTKKENPDNDQVDIENIKGNNTTIDASIGDQHFSSNVQQLTLRRLIKEPGKTWELDKLAANGNLLKASGKKIGLSIDQYSLEDGQPSRLQNVRVFNTGGIDSINAIIPLIGLVPDIHAIMKGHYEMEKLELTNPTIYLQLNKEDNLSTKKGLTIPNAKIGKLKVSHPDLHISFRNSKGIVSLKWDQQEAVKDNYFEMTAFESHQSRRSSISAGQLKFKLNDFSYMGHKGKLFDAGNGSLTAELNKMDGKQDEQGIWNWSGEVRALSASNFMVDSIGKHSGIFTLDTAAIEGFHYQSGENLAGWLAKSPSFRMKNFTATYANSENYFRWENAGYDAGVKTFSVDTFTYRPNRTRDSNIAVHPFQTDDLRVSAGKITIEQVDPLTYLQDSVVRVHRIAIQNAIIDDYRDRRIPFKSAGIRLLPTKIIQQIPFKLSVDSIIIHNANTVYAELDPKSNEKGVLSVTRMHVRFFPVRNFDLTPSDSLRIQANGYLMDSIWVRLRIRESYMDSLAGFFMSVRMKPAELAVLNPVLLPLSYVKVQSGHLDTLSMRAYARDYLAYGEMKMNYHNLKVKFLKDGSETKKRFLSGLITFVVNSFVVKNKNTRRVGKVFFIRLRDRSIMNYILKITMSGVASSVGAKGNHKIYKQYKKELKERNLPPFDYD